MWPRRWGITAGHCSREHSRHVLMKVYTGLQKLHVSPPVQQDVSTASNRQATRSLSPPSRMEIRNEEGDKIIIPDDHLTYEGAIWLMRLPAPLFLPSLPSPPGWRHLLLQSSSHLLLQQQPLPPIPTERCYYYSCSDDVKPFDLKSLPSKLNRPGCAFSTRRKRHSA